MRFLFLAASCVPVDSTSLATRPLGGTETGLLYVAELLAKKGHDCSIFTTHPNPISNNVKFINQVAPSDSFDILISVQDWRGVFSGVNAKKKYIWTGDGPEQFINFGIGDKRVTDRTDGLFVVSDWQRDAISELSGFPKDKIFSIRNGIDLENFSGAEQRRKNRLIYASSPNRGLRLAIELFRELWKEHPDLEFHIFSGFAVYDRQKPFEGPLAEDFKRLMTAASKLPGIFFHGNITQSQLAREYMKSALLFYPNSFVETSCIVAIEALAAGVPVVASKSGGLPETVGESGVLVPGEVGSQNYRIEFIKAAKSLINNQSFWQKCSDNGKQRVKDSYQWEHVVERILKVIV